MTNMISVSPVDRLREALPTSLNRLADLAYNYWWCWQPDLISLFQSIDPHTWELCAHNPVKLLNTVSYNRLSQLTIDPLFVDRLHDIADRFDQYMAANNTWSSRIAPQISKQHPVAYFCAEFGLHESLQVYSGGLGILAGDHLKSSSDLGVPLVGVGLLYKQGYFRQRLNLQGWQEDYYIDNHFGELPLELVTDAAGHPVFVELQVRHRMVKIQVWKVRVGRVDLFLMDTDRDDNDPIDRWLTGHLYGGNQETRIAQEVVLGIGGVQILQRMGIDPGIYHLNEGHAAFCLLEVARLEMQRSGKPFYDIEAAVRNRCVFTTHTPVPAGHDVFSADLMDSFFAHYWGQLQLSREQFLALGARRLGDPWEPFGMTVLALRLCRAANGVSELHGHVSRQMWHVLYPERSEDKVPIGYITNGVHAATWTAALMADLFQKHLGDDWQTRAVDPKMWELVDQIPDEEIWARHMALKKRLVAHTRLKVKRSREGRGESPDYVTAATEMLDPKVLTIGFARRFSPYKRGDLLLRDPDRAFKIFTNQARPVQIIFSGKAHPADEEGKRIIQRLMEWCRQPELAKRVAFIEDYDMHTARKLVQGVDIWLNNPRRPLEASGTSGQKVCFNGGINCSVLDGWWCEGYEADANGKGMNGWAIGEDAHTSDQNLQDQIDSSALYQLLEQEITPVYYNQDAHGVPHGWVKLMKESIKTNSPAFNTHRMIADYVTQIYAPGTKMDVGRSFAKVPS